MIVKRKFKILRVTEYISWILFSVLLILLKRPYEPLCVEAIAISLHLYRVFKDPDYHQGDFRLSDL